jgi:NAD-dependent SIR2 family protein deacetylase
VDGSRTGDVVGEDSIEPLVRLLAGRRIVALTGAGSSTESGIPDYRGEGTRRRARAPVEYRAFLTDPQARTRYWARSFVGWPRIARAEPNRAHRALAALERVGVLDAIVTQNVDGLHQRGGSTRVIELHGTLERVRCLTCGSVEPREAVQARLFTANADVAQRAGEILPDGDVELPEALIANFRVVACLACGGVLKPDVVFFGESVPRAIAEAAHARVREAEALLVVGTSLAVFSGYRFVRAAAERGIPIAIVNLGPTRGDSLATVRVEGRAGPVLAALARQLGAPC